MTHLKTKIAEYGIIVKDNKFLMLKFSKEVNPGEKWIFPGGRLDENDKPKKALIREITEETNLNVKILNPIGVSAWGIKEDHRYAVFFLCKKIDKNDINLSHEHQEFKWFSFSELGKIDFHDNSFKNILMDAKKLLISNLE